MLIIGHRGCHYDGYNQNTIRAFRKVFDEGAPAAEFDVQLTSDGRLVIVHDLELDKVSTGTGLVAQTSSRTIQTLSAGNPPRGRDAIPFLEDLLDLAEEYPAETRPVLHMELKGKGTGAPAAEMAARRIAENRLAPHHFLVSSFLWDELEQFSSLCPGVDTALLAGAVNRERLLDTYEGIAPWIPVFFAYPLEKFMLPRTTDPDELKRMIVDNNCPPHVVAALQNEVKLAGSGAYYDASLIAAAEKYNAVSLNLWHTSVSETIVSQAHEAGLKVLAYTVNQPEDARRMQDLGGDGFFTDFYSQFRHLAD